MKTVGRQTRIKLENLFIEQYNSYIKQVLSGERPCGKSEIHMVERQLKDLETEWKWTFDLSYATRPLVWMAANLKYPDGEKQGKTFRLEPWQVFIVMVLFGWIDNQTKNRRFLDAYIQVARKNGKSTFMGAIAVYMCFSKYEDIGAPVYIAATSLDQAGECFRRAAKELMLARHSGVQVFDSKNNKVIRYGTQEIIAVSASPKDGKLSHCTIIDEYHQHKNNDLINSIASGNISDPQSLTVRITTAGTELYGVCKKEYDKGIRILEGSIDIARYFVAVYELDYNDDVDCIDGWVKANPNYGVSIDIDALYARYEICRYSASDLVDFKTKNLNIWVNSTVRWANMEKWLDYCCLPWSDDILQNNPCYGGLDLSSNIDFTAFCADWPIDGRHYQKWLFFIPEDKVVEFTTTLQIPLQDWIDEGYVITCPGPVIDYSIVANYLIDFKETYNLQLIACDRWKLDSLARLMPDWFMDIAIEFSQSIKSMSVPINEFERQYLLGKIQSGNNPVMNWMMSCADSFTDSNGNIKIVKPSRERTSKRIDGVIASIMAHDTAETQSVDESYDLSLAISFC